MGSDALGGFRVGTKDVPTLPVCVHEWPHSTFHRFVKRGVYPGDWGGVERVMGAYGE